MVDETTHLALPGLRDITYTDADGRLWARQIPLDAPDVEAEFGIPVGPPSLTSLNLPLEAEVRLHNQLFNRGLFSEADFRRRSEDVTAACMAAFRFSREKLHALFSAQKE